MSALPLIVGGGATLLGSLFGSKNKPQVQQPQTPTLFTPSQLGISPTNADGTPNPLYTYLQTGMMPPTSSTTDSSSFGSSQTLTDTLTNSKAKQVSQPYYTPQGQELVDLLATNLKRRLSSPQTVSQGEQMGVINSILQDSQAGEQGVINQLSNSGALGGPSEAGARAAIANNNLRNIAAYRSTIPTTEYNRTLQDQNLGNAIIQGVFKGNQTDTSASSRTTGTTNTDWSQAGSSTTQNSGAFNPNFLNLLLQNPTTVYGQPNWADNIAGLSPYLMFLLGSGRLGGGANKTSSGGQVVPGFGTDYVLPPGGITRSPWIPG